MLNAGDRVEEIATGLQGEVYEVVLEGPVGRATIREWRVRFTDGTRKPFRDEKELKRLPDEQEGGFHPTEPVQD